MGVRQELKSRSKVFTLRRAETIARKSIFINERIQYISLGILIKQRKRDA